MTTETGRPSGGGHPAEPDDEMTLDQLITALIELRDNPDPLTRGRQLRHLNRHVVQGVLARALEQAVREALTQGLRPAVVARGVGVHPSKVYGKTPKVTPS